MTWAQYWDFQNKNFEVTFVIYAVLFVLVVVGFIGWLTYDKIQNFRGK